jgi:hypothetical protein
MSCLNIVIPDLFGTFPASLMQELPRPAPCLAQTLLARADVEAFAGTHLDAVLFKLFGGQQSITEDLPSAAISRVVDIGGDADGWWMHADPVFLKPDGDRLLLFDGHGLDIQPTEAERLAVMFNAHYRERGWRIEVGHPRRWYLRLASAPEVQTHPLSEVVGRNIDSFLPQETAGADWRFVTNEVQMLFHGAEVNREREARGVPPINSLWFWGGGRAPTSLPGRFSKVYAGRVFPRGLAVLAGLQAHPLPAHAEELLHGPLLGEQLLVNPSLQRHVLDADYPGWKAALAELHGDWIDPLHRALKKGQVRALRFFPCNGYSYRVDRLCLLRFWRKRRALIDSL